MSIGYRFKMEVQSVEVGSFDNLGGQQPTSAASVDLMLLKQNMALKQSSTDFQLKQKTHIPIKTKTGPTANDQYSGFHTVTLLNFKPATGQEAKMFPWSSPNYAGRPAPQSGFFILVNSIGAVAGRWKFVNAFPIEVNGATTLIAFDKIERA